MTNGVLNFGDGVWAGQFIGTLYAEAFFTDDVDALLDAVLAAIPAESDYAQMVRNVRAWHRMEDLHKRARHGARSRRGA